MTKNDQIKCVFSIGNKSKVAQNVLKNHCIVKTVINNQNVLKNERIRLFFIEKNIKDDLEQMIKSKAKYKWKTIELEEVEVDL